MYGAMWLRVLSVLLPVLIVGLPVSVGSWQWPMMGKGAAVFGGLLVLMSAIYVLAPFPYLFLGYSGWPHRRAMALVMVITGGIGLVFLQAAVGAPPAVVFPWFGTLTRLFDTPVWALAIAVWLWLNLAHLLGTYDSVILPPLLRRIGYSVPDHVTTTHAGLVDTLAESLRYRDDL
jgi:hypothetical protein